MRRRIIFDINSYKYPHLKGISLALDQGEADEDFITNNLIF